MTTTKTTPMELTDEQREEIEGLQNTNLGDDLYIAYLEDMGAEDFSDFDEAYCGQYASDEEFAQDMADNIGAIDKNLAWPHYCIDWELAARDLMYDYTEVNGHYFRNI